MVERVGEALRTACRKEFGSDWNYDVAWKFARAAIAAMREPTEAMIEYANNTVRADSDNMQCPDWYRAAIDGALEA